MGQFCFFGFLIRSPAPQPNGNTRSVIPHNAWKTESDLSFRAFDIENVLISYCHLEEFTGSDKIAEFLVPVVHGGERAVIRNILANFS